MPTSNKTDDNANSGRAHFHVPGEQEANRASKAKDSGIGRLFSNDKAREDVGPNYGYNEIRFHKNEEVNPYAQAQDARNGMDGRLKTIILLFAVFVVVFFFSVTLPTGVFAPEQDHRSVAELLGEFQASCMGLLAFFTGGNSMFTSYVWTFVVCGFAGAALALSGGVYQGAMKNALASPSTLGVMQGGSLGIVIYGLFIYKGGYTGLVSEYQEQFAQLPPWEQFVQYFGSYLSSLIGCFIIVALIMVIAVIAGRGHVTNVSLIIAGQVFAAVISVVIEMLKYYVIMRSGDENLYNLLTNAQSVTFTGNYNLLTVASFAVPLIVCFVIIFAMSGRLNLLAFNDEEARSMGISTRFTRNLMVAVCTVMTALVVAFCGPVGFVGFMAPHIARRFIGPSFRYLLPASALVGAIIVVAVNWLTQCGFPGISTGSTGVFTSIVGCAAFLVMALKQRGNNSGEWL